MGYVKRVVAVAGAGLVLAAAVPTFADAAVRAQDVLIRNTDAEPVPTKAIGTTPVSGSVAVTGPVSVAAPGRFTGQAEAGGGPGGENCTDLAVPAGKRYLVEAVHLDVNTTEAEPNVYIRLVRALGPGNTSLLRFTAPLTQRGPAFGTSRSLSGRVDGPFLAHGMHNEQFETLSVCVNGAGTSTRAVFVGEVESL